MQAALHKPVLIISKITRLEAKATATKTRARSLLFVNEANHFRDAHSDPLFSPTLDLEFLRTEVWQYESY
jgi:hypothetical protein